MPNWHPMLVHFALALPITATALYALRWCFPSRPSTATALAAAHWTLGFGISFLWLAVGSGLYAYFTVAYDDAGFAALSRHQNWGWLTAIGFTCALPLWRRGATRQVPGGFLLVLCLATGAALMAGLTGGANVYQHGIGVERVPTARSHE